MRSKLLSGAFMLTAMALLSSCWWDRGGGGGNPPPASTYTIGGTVTGLTSDGLVLQLNGANNIAVASGASAFAFGNTLTSGAAYAMTVSAQPATQTCTVSNGSGTVAAANVTNVAIACVTNTFAVSATVTGLTGTGLTLQLNGGVALSVAAGSSGLQTFANRVDAGTNYAVTVQTQPSSPNQQCTVTNGSSTNISTNVTNVTVTCVNALMFSGVAAVGSPLSGTVSVKDANGVIRSTPIVNNGAYTVDVNGMTAPFVFRAEGTANGRSYIVHSAAVAADVGGTINITQLTELVVDNIAGQVASAYFNNGNFSALTPAALNAEVAILKVRLLPVLTALGVDASIDLLRSRFTPLSSALDSALDILRVSVDNATNVATITNIVTQQVIQDTITTPANSESNPPVLDNTSNLSSALADSDAIKAALANFALKFANGLPSVASLESAMTATFLDSDIDRAGTAASWASNASFVGSSFTDADIKNIDYSDLSQITALVDFTIKDRNGIEIYRIPNHKLRKDLVSGWLLHGDQRVMYARALVHPFRSITTGCTSTGMEFHIGDANSANNGAVINHIIVFGWGLPSGGLRYEPPTTGGGMWRNTVQGNQGYSMAYSCATGQQRLSDSAIAAIPDNAGYVFVAFTSADNSARFNFPSGAIQSGPYTGMYWANIEKRPPTLAEVTASTLFPSITAPTSAALAAYTSGALTIEATGVSPNFYVDLILELDTAGGNSRQTDAWLPPTSGGTISASLSLTAAPPGDVITSRSVRVATRDAFRRTFMSGY